VDLRHRQLHRGAAGGELRELQREHRVLMATRAQLLVAASAAASLLALGGALALQRPAAVAVPKLAVASEAVTEPLPAPSLSLPTPHPVDDAPILGSRRVYDVDFSQTVLIGASKDADGGAAESSALVKGLHASWSLVLVKHTETSLRYRGVLSDVSAHANGQAYPAGDLLNDFNRPFFFDTDANGKVLSVAFDKASGTDARHTIKALVAASQVAVHMDGPDTWTTHEQDPTGEYEARYTRTSDPRHLRKERTQYLRIATDNGLQPAADQGQVSVRDTTTAELLTSGVVDRIDSETHTDLQFGKGMPHIHLTSVLASTLRKSDVDTSGLSAMNQEWLGQQRADMASPPLEDDPKAKEVAQRKADEKTLKDATLVQLERELAALPRTSSRERAVQLSKL
jgi:hypothetical protein